MTITEKILVVFLALSSLTTVLMIGEERKPISHITAAVAVLIDVLLIIGLLFRF